MALRIRYQYSSGSTLGYSLERLKDGNFFDFADSIFKSTPTTLIGSLPEDTGVFAGRYKTNLSPTPASQFTDGDYAVTVHNRLASNSVVGQMAVTISNGDDATIIPSDPWITLLPASYSSGTAGAILGLRLDAAISTRSTFAGGVVAGVTSPVIVETVNDKSGYFLAAAGLDAVAIEPGVNARQALSPILAAVAGTLTGSGTGTVVIQAGMVPETGPPTAGASSGPTRIRAMTDADGNRSSVTLFLPA